MKELTGSLVLILILAFSLNSFGFFNKLSHPRYERLPTGDIVFQELGGEQGRAVRAATGSPFTHCGVVFEQDGTLYVLEAIQPVSVVTLDSFRRRSKVFHARRLKNRSSLNKENLNKALRWGQGQLGKNYDPLFQWDDENLYCSELVWKIFEKAAEVKLCTPKTFQSYFLDKPEVRRLIRQRYGNQSNLPAQEPVVAPSDLAASNLLVEVPRRK
jgi:hypothetical protein